MQFTSFFPFLCLAARSFQEAAHRRQRRHHRRRCECRCCGCAGRDPAQGPADAAAAAAAEREGRGDPEALSFPSLLSLLSPLLSFPSLLSLSPFPLSLLPLSPSSLLSFSPSSRAQWASWDASWRLALQPIGGRGEGKGAFVGYVGVGGAGGKPSPAQKVQSSNKRDRGTTAAQAAGSWLKKIGTSITPSTNP